MDKKELYIAKMEEIKTKYHDAIVALCNKYGVDLDVGYHMLKAIGLANATHQEPLYEAEGLDIEAWAKDYAELLALQEAYING